MGPPFNQEQANEVQTHDLEIRQSHAQRTCKRPLRGRLPRGGARLIDRSMNEPAHIPQVSDIANIMEEWAPSWTAESWDRVGLLVGDASAKASRVWVALELDPTLLEQALAARVDMLLTHHPPLFKPLENLRTDNPATARLLQAASRGLAIFAAHTNLDAAPGGVNDSLAHRLGLVDCRPLSPLDQGLSKLAVFVPPEHSDSLAQALFQAGAGRIGDYRDCAFLAPGQGRFWAPQNAKPYSGQPGQREQVEELRLETVVPKHRIAKVVGALQKAHPYEEPAFDLYPLSQGPAGHGLGRVGELPQPMKGEDFLAWAARELGSESAQITGPVPDEVNRVAVMGGSGGDYLSLAAAAGAQVFITGEASHHQYEPALDLGVCLAVMGHYQTEVVVVEPWAQRLARELEQASFACEVKPITGSQSPWRPVAQK